MSNPAYAPSPLTGVDSEAVNGRNQMTAVNGGAVGYDANQNTTSALGARLAYDALQDLKEPGAADIQAAGQA